MLHSFNSMDKSINYFDKNKVLKLSWWQNFMSNNEYNFGNHGLSQSPIIAKEYD